MYTVIGTPKSRCLRVVWCLEELGQEYELLPHMPRSEELLAFNPAGKVPALQVGDDVIVDSVAICQFLADKHGQLTYPAGTIERAKQDSFTMFALDEMDAMLWTAAKHKLFLPDEHCCPQVIDSCGFEFGRALEALGTRLGDNEYVTGDQFTVPDIILTHCANWADGMFEWEAPSGKVAEYFDRVRARPAYLRAMEIRNAA